MIRIGTSGWQYRHWAHGVFYPEECPGRQRLEFYTQHFKTVELNASFYRLPPPESFASWYRRTPPDFLFAVKVPREITHDRRLQQVGSSWQTFRAHVTPLGEKLGPLLLQFPPSFRADVSLLDQFLMGALSLSGDIPFRLACEFRHQSWFCEEIYSLLRHYGVALCWADSARFPQDHVLTASFAYIRMHGKPRLYSSKYSSREIETLAKKIKALEADGLDVFVYFNNDFQGFAVENARELQEKLGAG